LSSYQVWSSFSTVCRLEVALARLIRLGGLVEVVVVVVVVEFAPAVLNFRPRRFLGAFFRFWSFVESVSLLVPRSLVGPEGSMDTVAVVALAGFLVSSVGGKMKPERGRVGVKVFTWVATRRGALLCEKEHILQVMAAEDLKDPDFLSVIIFLYYHGSGLLIR
jgi:hypothetical protein